MSSQNAAKGEENDGRDRITRILNSMGADRFGGCSFVCKIVFDCARHRQRELADGQGVWAPSRLLNESPHDNVYDLVWGTDPRVVGMLREFMYRYVGEVLKDGQVFAEYRVSAPPGAR